MGKRNFLKSRKKVKEESAEFFELLQQILKLTPARNNPRRTNLELTSTWYRFAVVYRNREHFEDCLILWGFTKLVILLSAPWGAHRSATKGKMRFSYTAMKKDAPAN